MKEIINQIFGQYTPLYDSNGVIIDGISGVDFEYIAGVLIFSICLLSLFKIIGLILKK